ncbi:MAG: MerR family transcriptional regulator [Candidatus Latescibacterota bacterium]|nr:MerR family transcriptional regulator [Candidatus Latescibacterota bacterium]
MLIGDLAEQAGVSTRTIRYYEELGIVKPAERTSGGFRRYCSDQLRRLQIIQGLKSLGFELEQIRQLFDLRDAAETGGDLARQMVDILTTHQREIDTKVQHYQAMKERNARGIDVLSGCFCCSVKVSERDCHQCDVYREHSEVPDLVECAIYQE